jgi:hypothetical protein
MILRHSSSPQGVSYASLSTLAAADTTNVPTRDVAERLARASVVQNPHQARRHVDGKHPKRDRFGGWGQVGVGPIRLVKGVFQAQHNPLDLAERERVLLLIHLQRWCKQASVSPSRFSVAQQTAAQPYLFIVHHDKEMFIRHTKQHEHAHIRIGAPRVDQIHILVGITTLV